MKGSHVSFPRTLSDLRSAGWKMSEGHDGTNYGVCRNCGDDLEWWESPHGKKLPFNIMRQANDPAIAHFNTCTG